MGSDLLYQNEVAAALNRTVSYCMHLLKTHFGVIYLICLLKSSINTVLSPYHLLRWPLITQMTQKLAISLFSHDESNSSFMLQALISPAPFIPGSVSSLFLKIVNQFRENYAHKQLVRNRAREREMIGMIRWLE